MAEGGRIEPGRRSRGAGRAVTAAGPPGGRAASVPRSPERTRTGHVAARLDPAALAAARRALAEYREAEAALMSPSELPHRWARHRKAFDAVIGALAVLLGSIEPPAGERGEGA